MQMRMLGILCVLGLCAAWVGGADWYVDPENGSAAGDGSAGNPWQTLGIRP